MTSNQTQPKPNTARHDVDCERLVQAVRSHLGRIAGINHPQVESARQQLQRELRRAVIK